MDTVFSAIENSVNLDLSDENIEITMSGDPVSKEDARFMGLLRAKLRLAHIFKQLECPEEQFSIRNGYEIARMIMVASSSGSLNAADAPFDLGDYIIYQIISPLGLEPLIRELPEYYKAVKSREDWQEKFDLIFETGDRYYGPSLNKGKTFHLAGFPKVNTEEAYVAALDVSTNDETLYLGEFDSSIEGWLYSFWLRRYQDGSMETVKIIIEWLNTQLDAAAKAVG
ncbi:MAG: hypothetical protein GX791_07845 [Synergistaceae bacterium]|nr:hypothetical protein [Synergistaceae bacterium]